MAYTEIQSPAQSGRKKSNGTLSLSEIPTCIGVMEYLRCSYWFTVYICNTIQFTNWLKYIIHQLKYLLFGGWQFSDSSLSIFASAYLSTVYLWHWKWTQRILYSSTYSIIIHKHIFAHLTQCRLMYTYECILIYAREPILIFHCLFSSLYIWCRA